MKGKKTIHDKEESFQGGGKRTDHLTNNCKNQIAEWALSHANLKMQTNN